MTTAGGIFGIIDPVFPGNSLSNQILSDQLLQKNYFLGTWASQYQYQYQQTYRKFPGKFFCD